MDFRFEALAAILHAPMGEAFQFAALKQAKEELESDLQKIAIEEAKKK